MNMSRGPAPHLKLNVSAACSRQSSRAHGSRPARMRGSLVSTLYKQAHVDVPYTALLLVQSNTSHVTTHAALGHIGQQTGHTPPAACLPRPPHATTPRATPPINRASRSHTHAPRPPAHAHALQLTLTRLLSFTPSGQAVRRPRRRLRPHHSNPRHRGCAPIAWGGGDQVEIRSRSDGDQTEIRCEVHQGKYAGTCRGNQGGASREVCRDVRG